MLMCARANPLVWRHQLGTVYGPENGAPPLFSVLKRLFSPSDPFEKTLKTTGSSSDHYQYCLIREERSAYTAYRGVYRGAIFGAIRGKLYFFAAYSARTVCLEEWLPSGPRGSWLGVRRLCTYGNMILNG
jgi:hypothetical protein